MVPYQVIILTTTYDELACCLLFPRNGTLVRLTKRFPDILCAVAEGLIRSCSFMFYGRNNIDQLLAPVTRNSQKSRGRLTIKKPKVEMSFEN